MEQRPSGWYDDPNDDDLLRYWDGVVWTEHVANKRPSYGVVNEPAAGDSPQQWSAYQAQQGRQDLPEAGRRGHAGFPGFGSGRGAPGAPSAPGAPGGPGSRSAFGTGRGVGRAAGDGMPLSGWWRRVGALIVDWVLVGLLCLPFALPRIAASSDQLNAYWQQAMEAAANGATVAPAPPEQLVTDIAMISLVQTVVYLLLDAYLLSRSGVTPGRRLTGIRVRPVGREETVPMAIGLRRSVIKNVSNLFGGVVLLSTIAGIFQIVDYLWPLGDRGRQSLHDKAAGTEVVRAGPLRPGHPRQPGQPGQSGQNSGF